MKLRECPFCGNDAKVFGPDADRNVVSCRLGHGLMRSAEAWNTRTVDPLITQLGEALDKLLREGLAIHGDELVDNRTRDLAYEALSAYQEVVGEKEKY